MQNRSLGTTAAFWFSDLAWVYFWKDCVPKSFGAYLLYSWFVVLEHPSTPIVFVGHVACFQLFRILFRFSAIVDGGRSGPYSWGPKSVPHWKYKYTCASSNFTERCCWSFLRWNLGSWPLFFSCMALYFQYVVQYVVQRLHSEKRNCHQSNTIQNVLFE